MERNEMHGVSSPFGAMEAAVIVGSHGLSRRIEARKRGIVFYSPATDWSQCGQLLDDYDVEFAKTHDGVVVAMADKGGMCGIAEGPNRRVAACRAIVASHNPSGYVEVPDELVEVE